MLCVRWFVASAVILGTVRAFSAQPLIDPVADLFEPRPSFRTAAREQPPGPWRLPDAALGGTNNAGGAVRLRPPGRATAPPRPPFPLDTGDRVLLLGDALFEAELRQGYLETRLQVQ